MVMVSGQMNKSAIDSHIDTAPCCGMVLHSLEGTAHKHVNLQHGNIGSSNGKLTVVYDAEHGEH